MSRVKLGEVAREYKAVVKDNTNLPSVGLEHLTSGEIALEHWNESTANTFSKGFKRGHVLFGRRRAYLKKAAVAPFDGVCSGDITVIEAIPEKLIPGLLPFIIQNDRFFDYAIGNSAGSLSPRVKWESLKQYEFNLPELNEQAEMVDLLNSAYATKQAYRALFQSTDELIKSQFIEMFGNERQQMRLDELCKHFGDGDWIESKDQSAEGIRLIQTGNVGNGEYKDKGDKARYISEETFKRLSCTEVFAGDILISRLPDPIGRACIVPEMPKSITAVDCTIVRLRDCMLPSFFVNFTKTPAYRSQIDSFTTGSTRKRVSRANLGSIMVPVPQIEEQKRFVQLADQSDKSKFEIKQAINRIDDLIKSLMLQEA